MWAARPHVCSPRRLLVQAIARDNPALEAQPRAAAAAVPDFLGGCSFPSPSFTCFHLKQSVQVSEGSPRTQGKEGGLEKGEAASQGTRVPVPS